MDSGAGIVDQFLHFVIVILSKSSIFAKKLPMRNLFPAVLIIAFASLATLEGNAFAQNVKKNFVPETPVLKSDILTPEVLWSFGRVGSMQVSPDGTMVLYDVTYFNIPENKSYRDLYLVPVAGGQSTRITDTPEKESEAAWRPDGKKIGYISTTSGEPQLWEINPDGSSPRQVTRAREGISGFKYAPDMKHIFYIGSVKVDKDVHDRYPDLPLANARLYDDIMYRHWDTWSDGTYQHVFVATYSENGISGEKDIQSGERYDSPLKPYGGSEQIAWSADSRMLAYTCKKKAGKEYAVSTNSDIYIYNLEEGTTRNLTEGMMGYDQNPVFSPDGKKIAWESMARDGYEADKTRLFIADLTTGEKKDYSEGFDQNVQNLAWSADSRTIWFISDIKATDEIFKLDLTSGKFKRITDGIHNYQNVLTAGNKLVASRVSMSQPAEIYQVDPENGTDKPLTYVNKKLLDQLSFGKVESRWITTSDNKKMRAWVIYPPHFDPKKKYPGLLFCEGGPQSTVSQFWSYRWNFQMMAASNYVIIAPNRRGLPGFGQEWNEQISGDYGGQNMKDYLTAIDTLAAEPYIDKSKLGAVGASYGGYSIYYLAGIHQGRFKAFISHSGIFNLEALYSTTEEMWFVNWDNGGSYWDAKNAVAQNTYKNFSPHKLVQNWDTPMLVIHGERDYRIPYTQGMGAFNSARLKDIPAELLLFPEENHWILQAQNGILWQRVFADWLNRWLK